MGVFLSVLDERVVSGDVVLMERERDEFHFDIQISCVLNLH